MPYLFVGLALYLLYRYYSAPSATDQAGPTVLGQPDQPPAQPVTPDQPPAPSPDQPPAPTPTTPTSTVSWQPIPEGAQLQPGFDYRASAPPQGMLVMALIPSKLSSAGFTNVVIHKPGESFPNDWPDAGDKLRIEATLPSGAQPQDFNLDGVSVWQKVVQQTAGQAVEHAIRHVAHGVYETVNRVRGVPYPKVAVPTSNGVYAGLVRPPQSR